MNIEFVEIGKCCKVINGSTPSRNIDKYWNGNIDWLTPKDLSKNKSKYINGAPEKITQEGYNSCSTTMVPAYSLLFTSRAPIGHIAINKKEVCTNQGFKTLVPNDNVNVDYLYYAIKHYTPILKDLGNGATFKELSKATIEKFKIPLPPLAEQQRIAGILDAADRLRQQDQQVLQHYEQLSQSLFLEMFGDLSGEKISLSNICTINPKKSIISNIEKSMPVSFIPMTNVSENGKINLNHEKTIDEVWSGFTYFEDDDVIFAKITPCMENGKGGILKNMKNGIGFGSTEFHVLRPITNISTPEFLYFLTSSKQFRKLAEVNMTGSAGQKRVPKKFLENFKVTPPSFALQNQFAERVQAIETQKALAETAALKSEELFQSLLQRAFKGALTSNTSLATDTL